ncbi:hypothetical protein SLEP1_g11432 [Rubroshorea leprosula]|uniref:Uncharacterized protein n=1 Tax=Rubroshorea leprosula TaxID=152421 RepID=A0AAV5IBB4_9ROSI|nr:hypothetical protein SLEP1_g11432 [Rubroshorea leprosula]
MDQRTEKGLPVPKLEDNGFNNCKRFLNTDEAAEGGWKVTGCVNLKVAWLEVTRAGIWLLLVIMEKSLPEVVVGNTESGATQICGGMKLAGEKNCNSHKGEEDALGQAALSAGKGYADW